VYTADELATLDAASIDWPAVPEELDRSLRCEWHNRWPWHIQSGAASLVWREPHLVRRGHTARGDMDPVPLGNSELFDVHRVRIDLEQTLDDIHLRAPNLARSRKGVEHPLRDQLVAPASGYAFVGVVAAADPQRAIQQQERGVTRMRVPHPG
jgi:hypothetical protein